MLSCQLQSLANDPIQFANRLKASLKQAPKLAPIVVRLPNWVGDVCMSLPSVQALCNTGHPLIICGRPWAEALMNTYKPSQFVPLSGRFLADLTALRALPSAQRKQSLGLVMPDSLSSAALFALSSIKSAGYRDDGRSLLLHWPTHKPDHPVHAAQKWWLLTKYALTQWDIGQKLPDLPPQTRLDLTEQDLEVATGVLKKRQIDASRAVLLAPTATGLHRGQVKVWPQYAELAKQLRAAGFIPITCPPASERLQAQSACPDALLLEPMSIRQFCGLAKQVALVICNDSGVSHLAGAVGANQITLFGVTNPGITRPWTNKAILLGHEGQWPSLDEVLSSAMTQLDID